MNPGTPLVRRCPEGCLNRGHRGQANPQGWQAVCCRRLAG